MADPLPMQTSDPERIRALAHPVRLDLMDYLSEVGEATATMCAEHTGESVANCSFHLRTLAKYGFIEPAQRRGREKPWRAVSRDWTTRPDAAVAGSLRAVTELAGLSVLRETERVRAFLGQADHEPEEWVQATSVTSSGFWATAQEMAELSRQVQQLTDRFADRAHDPGRRPEGARRGRLFAVVNPDPAEQAAGPGDE